MKLALIFGLITLEASAMSEKDRSRSMTDEEIDRFYGDAAPDRGAKSQHEALVGWIKDIEACKSKPADEAIPYLGRALVKLSSWNIFQVPERISVYDAASATMLSIPGHAEYYRDRILKAQENTMRIVGDPALSGPARADYDNELMYGFQTLPLMPSVETVRVLGEMLSNDWVPPGNETADIADKLTPLSRRSTAVLAKFPIMHKPFNEPLRVKNIDEALAAWRQWHEEIKDGKRTFRFEGDSTEYDLNGPAPKEKLERLALASRMDKDRAARYGGSGVESPVERPVSTKTPLIALVLAVLAVIGSLIWYFRRMAKNGCTRPGV